MSTSRGAVGEGFFTGRSSGKARTGRCASTVPWWAFPLIFVVAGLVWDQPARAAILLGHYSFDGLSADASGAAENVTLSAFSDGAGELQFWKGHGNPKPSIFKSKADKPAKIELQGNSYFAFSVEPDPGFSLDLTQLLFDSRPGPEPWETVTIDVRSDADLFTASLGTFVLESEPGFPWLTGLSADFSLKGLTAPTEFRLYLASPWEGSGRTAIDNVRLVGEVRQLQVPIVPGHEHPMMSIPEPAPIAAWCLLGLGCVGGVWRKRRRARAAA